jgi:hypothetical protein
MDTAALDETDFEPRAVGRSEISRGHDGRHFKFYKEGDGQLDDSVETSLTFAVCFEYLTWTGHEDSEFHKQKRQPVMVGVA